MRTLLLFFLTCLLPFTRSFGQLSPSDKHLMDSLLQNDEVLKLFNRYISGSSYFRINLGVGNKLYDSPDKAVESLQNNTPLVISPSAAYYHKSGFGISVAAFLLSENNKTGFYQYSVSPFYNYTRGKVVNAGLSYTHYFEKDVYSSNTSPVQNEFYGNLVLKKPWLKPGISAGYSFGTYHEIIKIDTVIRVGNRRMEINYTDTTTIKLSAYSVAASLQHSFGFYNVFSKNDVLAFNPEFYLIAGVNTFGVTHKSTLSNYNSFTKKRAKRIRHFQSESVSNKFEAQSIGLDVDLNYSIGIFYLEPELYVDYYLPQTNDKRFTQIFNVNVGITF